MKLTRLKICDVCYLQAYTCSFKDLYYKYEFDSERNTTRYYNDLCFMKIPDPQGKKIMLEYSKEYRDSTDIDTFRNRIRFARNRINKWYAEIRDKRLMKKQRQGLWCSKLEEPPKFECSNKTYIYREKKYKKKEFFQTNKKYYNKNKYKRKFFKRNKFKGKSKANAPKKCKCWLYNEEVHYANECPKKKKSKHQ